MVAKYTYIEEAFFQFAEDIVMSDPFVDALLSATIEHQDEALSKNHNLHPIVKPKQETLVHAQNIRHEARRDSKSLNTEDAEAFMNLIFDDHLDVSASSGSEYHETANLRQQKTMVEDEGPKKKKAPSSKRKLNDKDLATASKSYELPPKFVLDEMARTPGQGAFAITELMTLLYFAHQNFLEVNSYSKIRRFMGCRRSRASIRRKIEKVVAKDVGVKGGLLQTSELRQKVLNLLEERFWEVIEDAIKGSAPSVQTYAKRLKAYALSQEKKRTK